jgi:hypothetical protein
MSELVLYHIRFSEELLDKFLIEAILISDRSPANGLIAFSHGLEGTKISVVLYVLEWDEGTNTYIARHEILGFEFADYINKEQFIKQFNKSGMAEFLHRLESGQISEVLNGRYVC